MTIQKLPIGELDVLIMGKVLPIRKAPVSEQRAIAETLIDRLNERIVHRFPFQIEFTIASIHDGCIRVKYHMAIKLTGETDAAAATVAQYPDYIQGARDLWDKANDIIEFMAEGRACTARYNGSKLTERLFGPVNEKMDLAQIVPKLNCVNCTREQVMVAIFEANPESFVDHNINRLKTGRVLAIPSSSAIAEIPVPRANMKVLKDMRRSSTTIPIGP